MNNERNRGRAIKVKIDPEEIILGLITSGISPRTFIRRDFLQALADNETDPTRKFRLEKKALDIQLKIVERLI